MSIIKATCVMCGEIELSPAEIRLVVCTRPQLSFYSFNCGKCQNEVRNSATSQIITLLSGGGVAIETWVIPAEALEEHPGPPISYDDVLDFALAMKRSTHLADYIMPHVGS